MPEAPYQLPSAPTEDDHWLSDLDQTVVQELDSLWGRNLRSLIPSLTHEISGPMVAIISGIEFLSKSHNLPEPARTCVREMRSAARRGWLTMEMLRMVSFPASSGTSVPNPSDCMARVLELLQFKFQGANVEVVLRADAKLPPVQVSEPELMHMLTALALTSLEEAKHQGAGSSVSMSVRGFKQKVVVEAKWKTASSSETAAGQPIAEKRSARLEREGLLHPFAAAAGDGCVEFACPTEASLRLTLRAVRAGSD